MKPIRILFLTSLVCLAAPAAASAVTIGAGTTPGLAVDAAGTAYIAWSGPENPATLRFCRLSRGAARCDPGAASSITAPGNTTSRAFVVVSGSRVVVVQYRYGAGVPGFGALYAFTSTDRGVSFPAVRVVGRIPVFEAVPGPGDTISGVTHAVTEGMLLQNSPLDGSAPLNPDGTSSVGQASLSVDHPLYGTVGLLDGTTPLAVFTDGSDDAQFRRYGGSGSVNDAANWTPAVGLGHLYAPKLAGGPSGLFLMGLNVDNDVIVRKWNGSTFGAPVKVGVKGIGPYHHLFQDSAGRLHAVIPRGDAAGLHLVHAVSDNGVAWSRSDVVTQNPGTEGGFNDPRVATARDHIGVAVWQAGAGGGPEIRVAAIGLPPPVLGKKVNVSEVSGSVRVAAPGTVRFVPLTGDKQIPVGSSIDTTKGKVRLTSAKKGGGNQSTVFFDGRFNVRQSRRTGLTDIKLEGGNFRSCRAGARGAKGGPRVLRRLWGHGRGRTRTSGHNGSGTVRGTFWLTEDRCDGTLFKVRQGVVAVRDFTRHRTVVLHAGQQYLAPAR